MKLLKFHHGHINLCAFSKRFASLRLFVILYDLSGINWGVFLGQFLFFAQNAKRYCVSFVNNASLTSTS